MRRECVVDVGYVLRIRIIGNPLCSSDAANAPDINLDITDATIVYHVPRHVFIV